MRWFICAAFIDLTLLGCADRALDAGSSGDSVSSDLSNPSWTLDLSSARDLSAPGVDLSVAGVDLSTPVVDLSSIRSWSTLIGPGTWSSPLINSATIDSHENLFVSDGSSIFVVQGATASVYLSASMIAAVPGGGGGQIQSLDVGPDDTLYFLAGSTIFSSTGKGQVTLQHKATLAMSVMWLGVVDANQILLFDYYLGGLEKVNGASETKLYDGATVMGATDCFCQSMAAQRDGVFFYLPGCNGSPLIKGRADGSGAAVLLQANASPQLNSFDSFDSVGRIPSGGFVASVENSWNQALIQLDENGNWSEIVTSPPMHDFIKMIGDVSEFYCRPIVAGPSGAFYIVGIHSIYRVTH